MNHAFFCEFHILQYTTYSTPFVNRAFLQYTINWDLFVNYTIVQYTTDTTVIL